MFFFIESSLIIILSGSASFFFLISSAIFGTVFSISFPLLKVMIAFTSSILELLEEPISWTPFGMGSVWEGNLSFSCTSSRLVILVMEYCRLSIF